MSPERLTELAQQRKTLLCVGLDPAPEAFPPNHQWHISWIGAYLREVIQASLPYVIGFKFNSAFYEQWGVEGWRLLEALRAEIPTDYLAILDGKRGDIAHTNGAYARAVFETLGFDAVTVHPYMGWESLRPFYEVAGKWVFVLLRTTEAAAWQQQVWPTILREKPISTPATIGWVWGAHHGDALQALRQVDSRSWLLMPGLGAQGAEITPDLPVYPALITLSRSILRDPATLPLYQARTAAFLP
jgi:orotidine-5'-phosphate decarboxylase